MKRFYMKENGLYMVFEINEDAMLKFLHFGPEPMDERTAISDDGTKAFSPVEVIVTGENREEEIFGLQCAGSAPGSSLKYITHTDSRTGPGRKMEWHLYDAGTGLAVRLHMQFFDGIPVMRSWTELRNEGSRELGIEYVSSFVLAGIEKEGLKLPEEKMEILIAHNAWMKELSFSRHSLSDFGLVSSQRTISRHSSQRMEISNMGSWSAKEHLPMGAVINKETGHSLFFQIEHNGSWKYEIGEAGDHLYLALSGPDEASGHWWKRLMPGETFVSVPVGVGSVTGYTDEIGAALTSYRRAIRRKHEDNRSLPIIFNDYMNCLFGEPTTEKEMPMIDRAAEAGCEYYVIDAGWYADGYWWDNVGEWQPSRERFPDGLPELISYIRSKGMIPGLWLEIEVMGINCPKAAQAGEDWFFTRHGKRVAYRSRWQLDFRSPGVIAHANEVIDRLVGEYGVGYIKMDYNIEPGAGTEQNADSFGDGLLMHNRAYLAWLESVMDRYPDLVIENCSSGGMRMDYAMLTRHSIQSTSDIMDYKLYSTIAANAPMALTPEQAAVWSYPLYAGDVEEAVFNMVNAMLLRIHQSGPIASLKGEREELVLEGLRFYKEIRSAIPEALPFWPLGLSGYNDPWVCLGLRTKDRDYLAVWRRDASEDTVVLPVKHRKGTAMRAAIAYPRGRQARVRWNMAAGTLSVQLPREFTARVIELKSFGVGRI